LVKRNKREPDAGQTGYQPTAREQRVLGNFHARRAAEKPSPRIKVLSRDKAASITPDHPEQAVGYWLLMEALGTTDADFVHGLLKQLAHAGSQGNQVDEAEINFLLSIVKGVKPKDQLEAMLAAQMAVVHIATLRFARRLDHVETLAQQDSAERALNKLARTYATQMEALKRYRTGGEQKVTVQHVSVSEGGQAIVGNVTQAARETAPAKAANLVALTDAQKTAMTIVDKPERAPVPLQRGRKDGGRSSP